MINLKILFIIVALQQQIINYTYKWQGSDVPGHCFASFEDFNGKQDFKVRLQGRGTFVLKYSSTLKKGTLHLLIKSSSKTILDKGLTGSQNGEFELSNENGEKFKFYFIASHADGNFDVSYTNP